MSPPNNRTFTLRMAQADDDAAVAGLLHQLDRHYRPSDPLRPMEDYLAIARDTMASSEGTRFALGRSDGGVPAGIACFAILRPGRDLEGLLYLKDLFVAADWRGRGLGLALLHCLGDYGRARGIARLDFTTDGDNHAAQRWYESLGAARLDKVVYSLTQPVGDGIGAKPRS